MLYSLSWAETVRIANGRLTIPVQTVKSSIIAPMKELGREAEMFDNLGASPKQNRKEPAGQPCWDPCELSIVRAEPSSKKNHNGDSPVYHCSKNSDSSGNFV